MEEEKVSAEEMTEQETSEFEEAFNEADSVEEAGDETGEETAEQEAEGEEAPEGEKSGEEKAPGEEEKKEEEPQQKIVINGREYTQEEIAQKLSEPRYGVLERLAQDAGMSVDEYLVDVENRYEESQIDERAKERAAQLMEQGMEENLAKHLARVEVENANFRAKDERAKKQADEIGQRDNETRTQAEARMKAEIEEFNSVYPDVREIPPEVLGEISNTGHSPVVAYQNYLLQKKEAELKALKQSKKNKESTPGSVKGTKAGEKDEFGEAFTATMKD